MKITVKNKEPEVKEVFIKDVPVGCVFEIPSSGGRVVKGLKLKDSKVVWLTYSTGNNWFSVWDGKSWDDTPIKILGRVTEIIVEED